MNLEYASSSTDRILVTGSNGFVGVKVVETLLEYGFANFRCFVRPSSHLERLKKVLDRHPAGINVELFSGDLLSPGDCREAAEGISIIYHLAAGFDKSFAGAFMNSALATRNLMDGFLQHGQPKRFVNVSSFAVYSNLKLKSGALLDETCPLEDAPQERYDAYGFGKLKQEELVREYGDKCKLPYVITKGPTDGVIMHVADDTTPHELTLKGGPGGKTYLGFEGPPGDDQDREILSMSENMFVVRYINPETNDRYGTLIYVRCKTA